MANKGCVITLEHREKIRKALIGRKHKQQTRDFMAMASGLRSRDRNGKFIKENTDYYTLKEAVREQLEYWG